MSEASERYARIAAGFEARLDGVTDAGWSNVSPCTEWTARDLVAHSLAVHRAVLTRVDELPTLATDADPVAAWRAASAEVRAALADPERAAAPVIGRFAPMPFEGLAGGLLCIDTLVHTWDLSRATGQDERLDAVGVTIAFDGIRPADEAIRGPGGFGPKIDPPPDADEQTRFLCFLGRRV